MLLSPVPPMSLIVTLPAVFAASPPKRPTRLSCAAFNCPPFTASFEPNAIVPSATLVILLPPLFKPALVKLTGPFAPPVIVTPLLSSLLLPAVILSTDTSFFNATTILPFASTCVMMLSPASNSLKSVLASAPFTLTFVPSFAV